MSSSTATAPVTPVGSTGTAPAGAVLGASGPPAGAPTTYGQLQYSYQPPPKASYSLQNQTRKTLSSLIHPSRPPTTNRSATRTGSMSESDEHDDHSDPISATGTTGSAAHTLSSQVGGHAGVLSSDDGSLIIKPCLHLEREFYDDLAASSAASVLADRGVQDAPASSPFESLRPWVPKYYGTLRLEGRARQLEDGGETVIEEVTDVKHKDKFYLSVEETACILTYIRKPLPHHEFVNHRTDTTRI